MSFHGYFSATELAFAQEKEQMIDRIAQARDQWNEAANLDRESSKKCEDLQNLKRLLSRGNIQLLRTQEEILRVRLMNAQSSYRIRQLRDEIWRFIPYAQGNVSTVDYQLSVAKPAGGGQIPPPIAPDEKLAKEFKSLRQEWASMLATQSIAFDEERSRRAADNQYFERFVEDFNRQGEKSHAHIDSILGKLVKRSIAVKSRADDTATQYQSTITIMQRRQKTLADKADTLSKTANERASAERAKAQKRADESTNAVRQQIQNIERNNQHKIAHLKEQNTDLHQRHKLLEESVARLKKWEEKLIKQNAGFAEHGKERIEKLECQLNALISAAAALETCPNRAEERVLSTVASAVGNRAATAGKLESLDLQIQRVRARLNNMKS